MTSGHKWQFKAQSRRHAFGWKSQPAITRLREAVSEIKRGARTEPIRAAEGVVALLERSSPALENVDSSSGAIGTAVKRAIAETEAGLSALQRLVQGDGYEITSADVWVAYSNTIKAAENAGRGDEVRSRIRALVDSAQPNRFVADIIRRALGLSESN